MNTRPRTALAVFLVGAAIGVFAQNAIPVGVFHDDGQYLILARSLAEHATYRFDNLPGAPPGLHYPPGYPAFLAVIWWIAPGNFHVFKLANALLLGVAAYVICQFARRVFLLGDRAAAFTAIAVVASAPFVWLNSLLISETLFVIALYATLFFDSANRDAGAHWHLATGAMAGATALVRSLADPLGPVLIIWRVVRWRRKDAASVALAWLAVVMPWKLWLHFHAHDMPAPLIGAYGEYGTWWRAALDTHGWAFVAATLGKNVAQIPVTLAILGWNALLPLRWLSLAIVAAFAGAGAVAARRRPAAAYAFALVYAAIVMLWPYEPDRFLWMLAPIAVAAFAAGVRVAYVNAAGNKPRQLMFGAALLVVAAGVVQSHIPVYRDRPWEQGLGGRGIKGEAAARLAEALPRDARIASDFDEIVHLQTGRVLVPALGLTAEEYVHPAPDSVAGARLGQTLTAFRITHVIVADVPTLNAVHWLTAHGAAFAPVASDSGGAVVFARTTDARPTPPIRP